MTKRKDDKEIEVLSLRQLLQRVWWIDSMPTLRKWVETDMQNKNHLSAIKVGTGRGTRYYFKKENVEKYIRAFEEGRVN